MILLRGAGGLKPQVEGLTAERENNMWQTGNSWVAVTYAGLEKWAGNTPRKPQFPVRLCKGWIHFRLRWALMVEVPGVLR